MIEEEEVGYPRPNTSHFQRLKSRRSNFLNFMKSTDLWILGSSVASMANLYIAASCLLTWAMAFTSQPKALHKNRKRKRDKIYTFFSHCRKKILYLHAGCVGCSGIIAPLQGWGGEVGNFQKEKKMQPG